MPAGRPRLAPNEITSEPYSRAISAVRSVEPSSTTRTSASGSPSPNSVSTAGRLSSSFQAGRKTSVSLRPGTGARVAPAPDPVASLHPLHNADHVALGIRELAQRDLAHDVLGAHDPLAAEALGLLQRLLDVRHLDVEGDVAFVAVGPLPDAAADPDAVAARVALARDHPVLHRVVGLDLPAEELGVVAPELLAVLP